MGCSHLEIVSLGADAGKRRDALSVTTFGGATSPKGKACRGFPLQELFGRIS